MDYENLIPVQIPKAAGYAVHPVLERHYSKRPGRVWQQDVSHHMKSDNPYKFIVSSDPLLMRDAGHPVTHADERRPCA
jgi:hypothetical protein